MNRNDTMQRQLSTDRKLWIAIRLSIRPTSYDLENLSTSRQRSECVVEFRAWLSTRAFDMHRIHKFASWFGCHTRNANENHIAEIKFTFENINEIGFFCEGEFHLGNMALLIAVGCTRRIANSDVELILIVQSKLFNSIDSIVPENSGFNRLNNFQLTSAA